jgi:hypothetical protein
MEGNMKLKYVDLKEMEGQTEQVILNAEKTKLSAEATMKAIKERLEIMYLAGELDNIEESSYEKDNGIKPDDRKS